MLHERFVTSFDGTQLFVTTDGQGPALVLNDGIGCDGYIWRYLRPALRERYRLVHWHYRGHGRSRVPEGYSNLDVDSILKDLDAVCAATGVEQGVFFGHSMGVQLVLEYALTRPKLVSGVVAMCGSYGSLLKNFHDNGLLEKVFPYAFALAKRFPRATQKFWSTVLTQDVSIHASRYLEMNHRAVKHEDVVPYFDHLASMDPHAFLTMLGSTADHNVEHRLGTMAQPVLIVAGEHDTFTPAWISRRMSRLIPNAELLVVQGGSHVAPLESPELVELRVEKFLERKVGWPGR